MSHHGLPFLRVALPQIVYDHLGEPWIAGEQFVASGPRNSNGYRFSRRQGNKITVDAINCRLIQRRSDVIDPIAHIVGRDYYPGVISSNEPRGSFRVVGFVNRLALGFETYRKRLDAAVADFAGH